MVNGALLDERMMRCHQWFLGQSFSYKQHDQTSVESQYTKFEPSQAIVFMQGSRHDHLIEVNPVSHDDEHRQHSNGGKVSFGSPSHQQQERNSKVDDQVQEEDGRRHPASWV